MKQLEIVLKEKEQLRLLAMVVKDSKEAHVLQDLDGKILAWNPGAERRQICEVSKNKNGGRPPVVRLEGILAKPKMIYSLPIRMTWGYFPPYPGCLGDFKRFIPGLLSNSAGRSWRRRYRNG